MKNIELKTMRKQLGMKSKELAEAIDVPVRTYQGWEQGRNMPDLAVRAIFMLLWMDSVSRETFLKYIEDNHSTCKSKGIHSCDKHGGYGFVRDCTECSKSK